MRALPDQAPELHDALGRVAEDEVPHLILDATIIATDRPVRNEDLQEGQGDQRSTPGTAACIVLRR